MEKCKPHILLIGGDGGLSGVPKYIAQVLKATNGNMRFTVMSDVNGSGYDFVTKFGARHVVQPGLRTSMSAPRAFYALRRIIDVIEGEKPDLLWAHSRMAVLLIRVLAVWHRIVRRPLPPLAITLHGLPFGPGHRPIISGISQILEAIFLHLMPSHHILFLSQAALDTYSKSPGIRSALLRHSTHVLENCSDIVPHPFRNRDGCPLLIMMGRAGYQKNYKLAAQIFGRMNRKIRLEICGEGTNASDFRDHFVQHSGLSSEEIGSRVSFHGPVVDVRPILQKADVFLSTSRYEGMPIAALEAFASGLPVATTDIPGMAEILSNHPLSVSFSGRDQDVAARQVESLIAEFRSDQMNHARKIQSAFSMRFSFSIWAERLVELVNGLLSEKKSGS